MVTFPMTLTDPNSVFKVMTLFEVEYVEVEYVTNGAFRDKVSTKH